MDTLFILNISASLFLCGLIWVIQLLHYPFFHRLDRTHFIEHQAEHKIKIAFIVIPVMIVELVTSGLLTFGSYHPALLHATGFGIVILIWCSTFFIQVPLHNRIADGYEESSVNKLVQTNWIRTILWTLKALLGIWILYSQT